MIYTYRDYSTGVYQFPGQIKDRARSTDTVTFAFSLFILAFALFSLVICRRKRIMCSVVSGFIEN